MTSDDIKIANGDRIATEAITEDSLTRHLQRVVVEMSATHGGRLAADSLYRYFRVDGADDGSFAMNVDGSSTAVDFEYIVPDGKVGRIVNITGYITDAGTMSAVTFGAATALTNGITIKALDTDDSVIRDFLNGDTLTTNADLSVLCGPEALSIAAAYGIIPLRWTLAKDLMQAPLILSAGQKLQFKVQDDLTVLTGFQLIVKGAEVDA